jgi:hypothetical protein
MEVAVQQALLDLLVLQVLKVYPELKEMLVLRDQQVPPDHKDPLA